MNTKQYAYGAKACLGDFIKLDEDNFSIELCDRILSEYPSDDPLLMQSTVYGNKVNLNSRKSKLINISHPSVVSLNHEVRAAIDSDVFTAISKSVSTYQEENYPWAQMTSDTGYELNYYEPGSFFREHVDILRTEGEEIKDTGYFRQISCSVQLNDDYEGGELTFFGGRYKVPKKKGLIVLFPSNFLFPHGVSKVTHGIRASIVTWFI
jgi:hypothetical protein